MAPPKSATQFDEFIHWLKEVKQLKPPAVRSYQSYIRHATAALSDRLTDAESVLGYFDTIAGRSDYYNRRTAWKSYAEWYKETKGVELPTPSSSRRDLEPTPLPNEVIAACQELVANGMNVDAIFDSTWQRVDVGRLLRNSDTTTVAAKYGHNIKYSVSSAAMRVLYDFTFPSGTGGNDRPLVPSRVGSYSPYPKERLREAIRINVEVFKPEPTTVPVVVEFDIQGFLSAYQGQQEGE